MIKIYGIPNCDTMKKARNWLDDHGVAYEFHNYRKDGVPEDTLRIWVGSLGWEALLNRRGTTWRKLDPASRDSLDEAGAIALMLEHPAIIRRPLLAQGRTLLVGFDPDEYARLR